MVVPGHRQVGRLRGAQEEASTTSKKSRAGNAGVHRRASRPMTRAEVLVGEKKIDLAVPILKQLIKDNKDVQIKAQAHNTLGECLFKANRYSEALWEFLYVDAVYNQDNEQAKRAALLPVEDVRIPQQRRAFERVSANAAQRPAVAGDRIPTQGGQGKRQITCRLRRCSVRALRRKRSLTVAAPSRATSLPPRHARRAHRRSDRR